MKPKHPHEMLKALGLKAVTKVHVDPNRVTNDYSFQRKPVPAELDKLIARYPDDSEDSKKRCYDDFVEGVLAKRTYIHDDHMEFVYVVINGQHHSIIAAKIGVPYLEYYVFDSEGMQEEVKAFKSFQSFEDLTK